ncbi:hypothetical protein GCM10009554_70850 [Kribbella koreensis]|uniref:Uncharacterized protein n=1 Tax=Kribbella koreensis TaxID=57909 RepID=A0ABP4C2K1_9ACTN
MPSTTLTTQSRQPGPLIAHASQSISTTSSKVGKHPDLHPAEKDAKDPHRQFSAEHSEEAAAGEVRGRCGQAPDG